MAESQSQQRYDLDHLCGLKSLTLCSPTMNDQKPHHNSCIMASNLMPPPPSPPPAFSHVGDYIGTESCLDMRRSDDVQMMNANEAAATTSCHRFRGKKKKAAAATTMMMREFPPPIPSLARAAENNLSPPQTPFVLRRYCTDDGRLILREERGRRHEYIRAHRSNGHLTLQLIVPLLDDDDEEEEEELSFSPFDDEIEKENEQEFEKEESQVEEEANVEEEEEIEAGSGDQTPESCNDLNEGIVEIGGGKGNGGGGGGGMCLKYNNAIISSSSCYLGMPVPASAIKPVHT